MKNRSYIALYFAIIVLLISNCTNPLPTQKDLAQENIIPKPISIEATNSSFKVSKKTAIILSDDTDEMNKIAKYFVELLQPAIGFDFPIQQGVSESKDNINFRLEELSELGNEGYILNITSNIVSLTANKPEGIFRGIQTIRQLFPLAIERDTIQDIAWELASGKIKDFPDFGYRGSMLDVACHFSTVDEVKQYLDWMTRYKMNVFSYTFNGRSRMADRN